MSRVLNDVERPVMFCLRILTRAEINYSPTEGEALAILYCLHKFAHIAYGQRVIIQTDNVYYRTLGQ